jgi:RNA polymerase sigma-70 factor (ECF subfamily)
VETSDETLCQQVARGDESAFDTLVERYQHRAHRLAWSLLRDADEARDLSQEAFLRVYRTAASFRGESRFSTWFYRVLVNLCLDHRRRRRGWLRLFATGDEVERAAEVEQQPATLTHPVDVLDREQTMAQVWAAVDRLSPQQRAAVILQVQDELSTKEIATVLKCSEATVRVHVHRALSTLRQALGKG